MCWLAIFQVVGLVFLGAFRGVSVRLVATGLYRDRWRSSYVQGRTVFDNAIAAIR
ncbi:hypothetical protein [Mycobacterium lepromatosis]|uniref:hypothetical protein n=1 Tax=Mycobacterium lepromatosis TaxID=480418 RepID=UPI000A706B0D|nr:hypothetical protein [Mycobacterium lepromatosis]